MMRDGYVEALEVLHAAADESMRTWNFMADALHRAVAFEEGSIRTLMFYYREHNLGVICTCPGCSSVRENGWDQYDDEVPDPDSLSLKNKYVDEVLREVTDGRVIRKRTHNATYMDEFRAATSQMS